MKLKKSLLTINTLNWLFIIITLIVSEPIGVGNDVTTINIYNKLPVCTSLDLLLAFVLLIINFLIISNNKLLCKNGNELNRNTSITLLTLNIIAIVFTIICCILVFIHF